ncbi:ABC transporter permease [candidate division KSB1 bacterium]|nr:ABC transporter permease [candidate division KSB1 bacterium]
MSHFVDTCRSVFSYFRQYKSRTFMTMFGIVWGTMTVILLLAFGVGVKKSMSKNMHGMGEGIVILWPGRTSIPFQGYGRDRQVRFREEDIDLIRTEIPEIEFISPEYSSWGTPMKVGDKINKTGIAGVIPEYGPMRNVLPVEGGRWINELDVKDRKRVAFIGDKLRDFLFGENADAVGKYFYVGDSPFRVIGVLKPKIQPSCYTTRDQDRVYIPVSTFASVYGYRYLNNIVYKPRDPRDAKKIQKKLHAVFGKKYKFDPEDSQTLFFWDTTETDKFIFYFSLGFTVFMGVIGVITLIVGGIGLANIMYVVVQERTKEIGIQRAVGAKSRHIMGQFILESFIIIGISALLGFGLAYVLIQLVSMMPIEDYVGHPVLSLPVALISISVLSIIGFLAGYFPSRRAAKLVVIDCLRT